MHGDADLFGERVVRDLLAYLRLACNPNDRGALSRIADRPRRGLARLQATLLAEPTTVAELPTLAAQFDPTVASSATALVAMIYALHAEASRGASVLSLLDLALRKTGYGANRDATTGRHPGGRSRAGDGKRGQPFEKNRSQCTTECVATRAHSTPMNRDDNGAGPAREGQIERVHKRTLPADEGAAVSGDRWH
jgi:hypothetical protein